METTVNAPGKKILIISGILLICFGAVMAVNSIIGLTGGPALLSQVLEDDEAFVGTLIMTFLVIELIFAIIYILLGVLGVMFCAKADKAKVCITIGIILFVLQLIGVLIAFSLQSIAWIVLLAVFIAGAYQNKKILT